jgi:hypothetical protein
MRRAAGRSSGHTHCNGLEMKEVCMSGKKKNNGSSGSQQTGQNNKGKGGGK